MSILICGSMAYDSIMVFEDHFKNHILPDKVHMLNVAFLVPGMRKAFGGCAGNIAYNLKLLGGEGYPMATVGSDFAPYRQRLDELGISQRYVLEVEECFTAQAFIITDLDDNQITAFHPGAMAEAHRNQVQQAEGIDLGIVAPDGREAMLEHAEQFAAAGVPFVFDPGQGLPMFNGEELRHFVDLATWMTVNDYESELVKERTGFSEDELAQQLDAYIVTKGSQGSCIYTGPGDVHQIPAAKPARVADPTGCGDAYRAGLLYGLQQRLEWPTIGRIASLMGAVKVEQEGTQNHYFSLQELRERFNFEFHYHW